MKSSQLKIFVSSTFVDLKDTREEVLKFLSVLKSDLISMELFGSDEKGAKDICLNNIRHCNFFIGIYAERYGYIEPESSLSITELEYHEAYTKLQNGTMSGLLLYVLDPDSDWPIKYVDRETEPIEKLKTFKALIGQRHTLTFFKDKKELPFSILRDTISKLELSSEETYVPRIAIELQPVNKIEKPVGMGFFSPELAPLFYGRFTEIQELSKQIIQYHFSLLIGVSGIGKTSLLNAGLIPELRKMGWLIAVSRPLNAPLENLRRSIWNQMIETILPEAFGLVDVIRTVLTINPGKKVLIIIDQFDDILNDKDQHEISKIILALNQLYQLKHLDLHLLISYRGDLESEIGMIWQKISGAADGLPRYYLSPLGADKSRDILMQTFINMDIQFEDTRFLDELNEDLLLESRNNGHLGVFPPFIQMIISTVPAYLKEQVFTRKAYLDLKGSKGIISNYLYSQLSYLGSDKENGIRFLVTLVSNYGTKTQKSIEQISTEIELSEAQMQPILSKLLDLRLIRPLEIGYEITHDLLARTILNGLMTDEEKDIRRFKYLLESKAHAFNSTASILTYSEHLHIYKYRKRISCNELELKLLAVSSDENRLPFAYWLTSENLKSLEKSHLFGIEACIGTIKRLNLDYVAPLPKDECWVDDESIPLKALALKNTESAISALFENGIETLEADNGYKIIDRAKYKTIFAAITMAKFGDKNDLKVLKAWLTDPVIDAKQKYIGLRSVIYLSNRIKVTFRNAILYQYNGRYWKTVLKDLNPKLIQIKLKDVFSLIEVNEKNAPYLDYLVELLSRIVKPKDYDEMLAFIRHRALNNGYELLFDKYLILALKLGANFNYFTSLIKDSVNALNVKYSTLLHLRIAKLATEQDFSMLSNFIDRMLTLKKNRQYDDPTGGLMQRTNNQYLYAWIMACAYSRLARRQEIPIMIELLQDGYYTIRNAAFNRLLELATEDDLRLLLTSVPEKMKYVDYTSLLFILDCKIYLLKDFDQIWSENKLQTDYPDNQGVSPLLSKLQGKPFNPERTENAERNYDPEKIPHFSDLELHS